MNPYPVDLIVETETGAITVRITSATKSRRASRYEGVIIDPTAVVGYSLDFIFLYGRLDKKPATLKFRNLKPIDYYYLSGNRDTVALIHQTLLSRSIRSMEAPDEQAQ